MINAYLLGAVPINYIVPGNFRGSSVALKILYNIREMSQRVEVLSPLMNEESCVSSDLVCLGRSQRLQRMEIKTFKTLLPLSSPHRPRRAEGRLQSLTPDTASFRRFQSKIDSILSSLLHYTGPSGHQIGAAASLLHRPFFFTTVWDYIFEGQAAESEMAAVSSHLSERVFFFFFT